MDAAAWRAMALASVDEVAPELPGIKSRLALTVRPDRIAGVNVFRISCGAVRPENRRRLLMHLHGGYVLFPGEAGAGEGMVMAGYGGFEVVSVDYRMAPDHPFPAALPAAIATGTPWIDLTGGGDTFEANAFVDNGLGIRHRQGRRGRAALRPGGRDLRDPLISPIFGDFAGLPPAILTSGTRDLLLSQTLAAHRRLRRAGVNASSQVFEGMSHAQFLEPFVP